MDIMEMNNIRLNNIQFCKHTYSCCLRVKTCFAVKPRFKSIKVDPWLTAKVVLVFSFCGTTTTPYAPTFITKQSPLLRYLAHNCTGRTVRHTID